MCATKFADAPSVNRPDIQIIVPLTQAQVEWARDIFREYAASLEIDLCFQNFEQELLNLPGEYAAPRGTLVLALRPLDTADYPNAAEMKRLYVRKAFRRFGLGRMLAESIMDCARQLGYASVLLDTLDDMESARALYAELGFCEIPPYYHNPIAGSHYLKADL
jgi:putative acetyltransferase